MRKILLMMLAAVAAIAPASAQERDGRWIKKAIGRAYVCDSWGACRYEYRYGWVRHGYAPTYAYPPPHTHSYRYDAGRRCEQPIEVLSTEHQEESNARNAAIKLWMAQVQWKYGGSMMDMDNATEILWRCSASNAHDTLSGRLAEGVAKLAGKEGQNVRCQLWARPCSGAREPDRGPERRR